MNNFASKQFSNLVLASVIALAMVTSGGLAAAGTASQEVVDARQEAQIWTTYALSPYLRANDLQVSARNGKVTLTGKVEEDVNKDLAKQIALGVSGVKEVDNQIVVAADYVTPARPAERGFGEVVDDASITAAVKSKLLWSKHTDGLSTKVETNWGKVTLQGTADTEADKNLASRLAWNTRGVVSVNNQLVVNDKKPSTSDNVKANVREAGHDIADGWITTKVKSTFMYSSNVSSADISVNTRNGIVTLSGRVNSSVERALAIELAENVRGVKSVNSKDLAI